MGMRLTIEPPQLVLTEPATFDGVLIPKERFQKMRDRIVELEEGGCVGGATERVKALEKLCLAMWHNECVGRSCWSEYNDSMVGLGLIEGKTIREMRKEYGYDSDPEWIKVPWDEYVDTRKAYVDRIEDLKELCRDMMNGLERELVEDVCYTDRDQFRDDMRERMNELDV